MHDATFLGFHLQFLEYLAQVAAQGMQVSAGDGARVVTAADQEDPVKCALVQQCKQFQRRGPTEQQAWWAYCDSSYSGIRDPSRHDVNSLSNFLALYMDGGAAARSGGGSYV
ncbi:unnamed protein product [Prorocentrum cordatum]|uniref:Uncharacterized protein n=1 Tax=Prorocentrum cordatum TaxID=2364126 RepID=A0ABN9XHA4_9DINO|nr:unnamed protein product [Polarella glacialis]